MGRWQPNAMVATALIVVFGLQVWVGHRNEREMLRQLIEIERQLADKVNMQGEEIARLGERTARQSAEIARLETAMVAAQQAADERAAEWRAAQQVQHYELRDVLIANCYAASNGDAEARSYCDDLRD